MSNSGKLKILYVTPEVWPYSKVGGLGDVAGALTYSLMERGHDVRVVSPYYQAVEENHYTEHEAGGFGVRVRGGMYDLSLRLAMRDNLPHYFIENKFFFRREHIYNYFDDGERFTVFCRGALEALRKLGWRPDIIHCNDWQTGPIPALLKTSLAQDPFFEGTRTAFTIHNLAYQGSFPDYFVEICGLPGEVYHFTKAEAYGRLNFMKMGITYSDRVNTVSPTYSREILTAEHGENLDTHLAAHAEKLSGILNGLDPARFNPETDPDIYVNYSKENPAGKEENKKLLMEELGLEPGVAGRAPLFVMVSRLAEQKGFGILSGALPRIMKTNARLAALGDGDTVYSRMLAEAENKYPGRVRAVIGFDQALAQKFYAGGDVFLMPSKYEPCGLGQMIAMRYGAVPLVRASGGLADTVRSFSQKSGKGNGIVFRSYTAEALAEAAARAADLYSEEDAWRNVVRNGMECDFSWSATAEKYEEMYRLAMQSNGI